MVLKFLGCNAISHNVYRPLRHLTYISMLTLTPFRFVFNSKKLVQTSKLFFVVSIAHYILYVYFHKVSYWGDTATRHTGFIAMTSIFVLAMSKRRYLVNILQKCIAVDEILVRLGIKLNNQRITRYNIRISIGMVTVNMLYFWSRHAFFYRKHTLRNAYTLLNFILPHINVTLMIMKFLCFTNLTKTRFSMLNEILQDILDAQENTALELTPEKSAKMDSSIIRRDPDNAVKQVSKIHSILCDICDDIEDYFTYPFLVTIAICFWFIVFDNFHVLDAVLSHKDFDSFVWGCFSQVLWAILFIFLIVEASNRVTNRSSSAGPWVHKILNTTDDRELKDRLSRFSLQLIHRKVNFTAARFLSLDRAIILTIAGSASTYLIVLMQARTKEYIEETPEYFEDYNGTYSRSYLGR